MESISPTVINLIIFVLAIYVGYHVVWNVTSALHTPLMAVTNAISAIIIVGAMLAAALTETVLGKTMGVLAVALASVNVFGGFLVTRRMLEMFRKKEPRKPAATAPAAGDRRPVTLKAFLFLFVVTLVAVVGAALIAETLVGPGFERGIIIAVLAGLVVFPAARWAECRGWIKGEWSPGGRLRTQQEARPEQLSTHPTKAEQQTAAVGEASAAPDGDRTPRRNSVSLNFVVMLYLVASVCFIQALKGLSHPTTSRIGNTFGMVGMAIAVFTTLALILQLQVDGGSAGLAWVAAGVIAGGTAGTVMAKRVEMTKMPELVAFMHSMIGLAAVFIAIAAVAEPWAFNIVTRGEPIPAGNRLELFIGTFVGAITFSGSVIAFGKLSGKYKFRLFQGAPVTFAGQHLLNLALALVMLACGVWFVMTQQWTPFWLMTIIAFVLGVLIIIPIGGADMPVVVSMLNSYSGWAAAGIGFSLNNPMLIIAGSLVGSSGAILSYIMCKAMNRSFFNVILGGFGGEAASAATGSAEQRPVKSGSADDAAFLLANADSVIIVPGYGLAVARAQHPLKELTEKLIARGIFVKYAIHPVAGRMPGHMNVLLAEAEVPYDQVFEMEDINSEFGDTDVVLVLGANDVVNPAAKDPKSPIAGMPILEAHKAHRVIVNKRSMASGYAGLDNELFYMDKTMMVFGDAKKVVEDMVKAVD